MHMGGIERKNKQSPDNVGRPKVEDTPRFNEMHSAVAKALGVEPPKFGVPERISASLENPKLEAFFVIAFPDIRCRGTSSFCNPRPEQLCARCRSEPCRIR